VVPAITSDDVENPIGDPECMSIEKDMEKSEEFN